MSSSIPDQYATTSGVGTLEGVTISQVESPQIASIYNSIFWWAYIANLILVSANALTFRFADMINMLGGSDQVAGTIVSVGSIGALVGRLFLGQWIDRYGVRPLWIACSLLYLTGMLVMVFLPSLGFLMYGGRTLFAFGLGGMFACSMTHIQNQVPPERRTEMIATLGSSGFLGMILGSQLGDVVLQFTPDSLLRHSVLLGTSSVMAGVYLVIVAMITRHERMELQRDSPAAWPLLKRYWPGWVVIVGIMIGMAFACSTVFIARYATTLGLKGVGTYFTAYAVSAFIVRLLTRHTSKVYGRHRMIVLGMIGHVIGYTGLCFVTAEWQFILPAICSGFAHALLFPCVVSLGTEHFPRQYRGTGTTLVLCFIDIGGVVFAPLLGAIIDQFGFRPMFLTTAGAALATTVLYAWMTARTTDPEMLHQGKSHKNKCDSAADVETESLATGPVPETCKSGCA
ncbi:MFS transporter [Rubinisphaera italica]|uniref:Major facilitator superfamily transporter n=1 Tax=Rubinisphaera italica TaxID=2527969 RepID=A0A5C5XH25_9PLAN|nr:MFS transporter [Rubinisphaera italica]TWT61988.1 major facilitator superfamily transporter [Rubinisphaera italica]